MKQIMHGYDKMVVHFSRRSFALRDLIGRSKQFFKPKRTSYRAIEAIRMKRRTHRLHPTIAGFDRELTRNTFCCEKRIPILKFRLFETKIYHVHNKAVRFPSKMPNFQTDAGNVRRRSNRDAIVFVAL